jgi:antitoxin component YwqK of YwqJK toxin-antitoxin module
VETKYIDGKLNGLATSVWHENGQKLSEFNYHRWKRKRSEVHLWLENGHKHGRNKSIRIMGRKMD